MAKKGYKITNTKFLRRSIITVCVLVFLVACVIVTGFMTVVRNVNVSFLYVPVADAASEVMDGEFNPVAEPDNEDEAGVDEDAGKDAGEDATPIPSMFAAEFEKTVENLESLKKSNLIFLRGKKIEGCVSEPARIKVSSYAKKYPCSLDVVIEEREETFTSYDGEKNLRTIYDSYGDVMETTPNDDTVTGYDGSPDIEINPGLSDADIAMLVKALDAFEECFSSARRLIAFMDVSDGDLYIELRSGLEMEIVGCGELLAEKMDSAYAVYSVLKDAQRISGRIVTDGNCRSRYVET